MIFSAYRELPHPDLADNKPITIRLDYKLTSRNQELIDMYLDKAFVVTGRDEKQVDTTAALFWLNIAGHKIDEAEDEVRGDYFDWLKHDGED